MLYCPKCRAVGEESCPSCGYRELREPQEGDSVFLLERSPEEMEEAVSLLQKNNIPIVKEPYGEKERLFVPFSSLYDASEALRKLPGRMTSGKRAFWKAFSLVLFLLLICLVVWGTDGFLSWLQSVFA